jgi:L-fuconolactonase
MMIDAHQHLWRIGEHGCAWPTADLVAIHRHFELQDSVSVAAPLGVEGTLLVQSQPDDRDTDWLLETAERSDWIKGVVGWVDLASAVAPRRIAELATRPKMRGLRPMLQSLPEDDWILDRKLDPAVATMKAHGLTFDALVFTRHLRHIRAFAERHPDLSIVIDHGAKPPIASGALEAWRSEINAIATLPNVFCKLSGLLTEAGPHAGGEVLRPYAEHLLESFGTERLMWGSDWPVLNLAGTYAAWLEMARDFCRGRDEASRKAVFGGNARRFYGLTDFR